MHRACDKALKPLPVDVQPVSDIVVVYAVFGKLQALGPHKVQYPGNDIANPAGCRISESAQLGLVIGDDSLQEVAVNSNYTLDFGL